MVQASSTDAALRVLDFSPTNPPPLFASLGVAVFANTTTDGLAVAELFLNPSHLDAGTYTLTLRASALNNATGTTNITVIVRDNPAILTTRWREAVSGSWNDPARWSDGLPDVSKVAVLDLGGTYTVTVNADATVAGITVGGVNGTQTLVLDGYALTIQGASVVRRGGTLDFRSGILTGPGALTISSTLNWIGGTMEGEGRTIVGPAGRFNLSGVFQKFLSRQVDSGGTNDWSGTGEVLLSNAQINNLAGGVFQARGGANMSLNNGITAVFNNAGIFVKTGLSATSFFGVTFNNSGTVNVTEGTLSLDGGGANSAAFRIEAGATMAIVGDEYSLRPGSTFGGSGAMQLLSGAILSLEANVNVGTLAMEVQIFSIITGGFKLSNIAGATISFTSSATIPGSMDIAGALNLAESDIVLQIDGTLTLAATGALNNPGTVRVGAFQNNGGSIIGNAPIVMGSPALLSVRMDRIELISGAGGIGLPDALQSPPDVILSWSAEPERQFMIQSSRDLILWDVQPSAVTEVSPGSYQAYMTLQTNRPTYFRLHWRHLQ